MICLYGSIMLQYYARWGSQVLNYYYYYADPACDIKFTAVAATAIICREDTRFTTTAAAAAAMCWS